MKNLTVKSVPPWHILGISRTPLKTIGNPCISNAQPWCGTVRTTGAIKASPETLQLSQNHQNPLATVSFCRLRDAEDLTSTQGLHLERAVHQKRVKDAYWNSCEDHWKTQCFWRLLQKRAQSQLRTTRCEQTQVRMWRQQKMSRPGSATLYLGMLYDSVIR